VTNKPPVQVEITRPAARDLKRLLKKYPHIVEDIEKLIHQLEAGETPGDRIVGVGRIVFKVRIRSSDLQKGKSGGYRVIYYLQTAVHTIIITLYPKNERVDLAPEEIRRMIEEYEQDQ